ncbi:MAG: hypothetical protein QXJ68_00900 [Methanocellales archaeon]
MMQNIAKKTVQLMGITLILLGLLVMYSYSVFSNDIVYSNYGGVIIESNDELSISNQVIVKAGSNIPEVGTSAATAVTMSSTNPVASTGVTKKNWVFRIDVNAITNTTPSNIIFKIELYQWNSTALEYNLVNTLYIKSDDNPTNDEGAKLIFGLSSTPSSSEAFMVLISRV